MSQLFLQQHQTTAPYTVPIQAHSKEISLVIGKRPKCTRPAALSSTPQCGCSARCGRRRRPICHAVQLINEQTRRSFWWTDLGGPTPPCRGNSGPINLMHILTELACNHSAHAYTPNQNNSNCWILMDKDDKCTWFLKNVLFRIFEVSPLNPQAR